MTRTPHPNEREPLLEMLGRAFYDDPIARYLFPEDSSRRAGYGRICGLAMDLFGDSALVLTDDALRGAAIWQHPSPTPLSTFRMIRITLRSVGVVGSGLPRALQLSEVMREHHLKDPHYYLSILGTEPGFHGQGIGSSLIHSVLERCDREQLPAYLESSNETNLPFYERHGFEVVTEARIPNGPSFWPMVRAARRH